MASFMVYSTSGRFVELKIGYGNFIYLDGSYLGGKAYKVSNSKIYYNGSKVHDNDNIREFARQAGYIKPGFLSLEAKALRLLFFVKKYFYI